MRIQEIVSSWSLKVIQGPITHQAVTLKSEKYKTTSRGPKHNLQAFSHMFWGSEWQNAAEGDKPVFLLGEDGNSRGLKDSDLHHSAVGLHRFAVIKGDDKQLHHRREGANEPDTDVQR